MDFWHTANCAFSPEEREAFNNWKAAIYLVSEKALNEARRLSDDETFSAVPQRIKVLHDIVCAIPWLEDDR